MTLRAMPCNLDASGVREILETVSLPGSLYAGLAGELRWRADELRALEAKDAWVRLVRETGLRFLVLASSALLDPQDRGRLAWWAQWFRRSADRHEQGGAAPHEGRLLVGLLEMERERAERQAEAWTLLFASLAGEAAQLAAEARP